MVHQKNCRFPCGDCKKDCKSHCVRCEACNRWYHASCEKIGEDTLAIWNSLREAYICLSCRTSSDGTFDYLMGLTRLQQPAKRGIKQLTSAVQRELLLIEDRYVTRCCATSIPYDIDSVAQQYINRYMCKDGTAIKSTGDGDCLFNAISIILCGDESMSVELKYKCCLEMVSNGEKIQQHKDKAALFCVSPDYEEAVIKCAKIGGYSSAWTMIALSNITKRKIESLYPLVNGAKDVATMALNCVFHPSSGLQDAKTMKIMWTHTVPYNLLAKKNWSWTPNHFVPFIDDKNLLTTASQTTSTPLISKPATLFVPKYAKSTTRESNWRTQKRKSKPLSPIRHVVEDLQFANRFESLSDTDECESFTSVCELSEDTCAPAKKLKLAKKKKPSRNEHELLSSESCVSFSEESLEKTKPPSKKKRKINARKVYLSSDDDSGSLEEHNQQAMPPSFETTSKDIPVCEQLPSPGNFLTPDQQLEILEKTTIPLQTIPAGDKTNAYCVINNSQNNLNRQNNIRSAFADDCGIWDTNSGNTVNIHFMMTEQNRLKGITLKNGVFCIEKRTKKNGQSSKIWKPLEIQPTEENLFQIHRYYTKHKGNHSFRKRVTCFDSVPSKFREKINFAIVEYCGEFKETAIAHGNAKDKEEKYIRTDPVILQKAYELSKEKKTTSEVMDMMGKNDSFQAPRNSKQIRNKKYRETSKESPLKPVNVADEIYQVLCSLQTSDFIQQVIFTNSKRPIVILYKIDQMKDLKANCIGGGSIIGIDKTFNLGSCFVSALTYKQKAVIQRETRDHPIMLGPMMLHFDSDYNTYYTFLSHIRQKIGDTDIIIGSDEEKAITKAISNTFPTATHLLCTKHMKDNIRRNLQDKIGCSREDREKIVKIIFGPSGIAKNSDDSITLNTNVNNLQPFFKKYPQFETYFNHKVKHNLIHHVIQPINNSIIQELWTNNNTESMNNRMKLQCNWKTQKMPSLINSLEKITSSQMRDLRRSLYGFGNYKLLANFSKFRISPATWAAKTPTVKGKLFQKFLNAKKVESEHLECSKFDENFQIPKTNKFAKKPNQRSRPRAERTRSHKKLKKPKKFCHTDESE